jgi:hypothetical protein
MTMAVRNQAIFMTKLRVDIIRKILSVIYNVIYPFKNIRIPVNNNFVLLLICLRNLV